MAFLLISTSVLMLLLSPLALLRPVSIKHMTAESLQRMLLTSERNSLDIPVSAVQQQRRTKRTTRKSLRAESPKPDPLVMVVSIDDRKLKLNNRRSPENGEPCYDRVSDYGTVDDPSNLSNCLAYIFQRRTEQYAFKRGMEQRSDLPLKERIEKTVYFRQDSSAGDLEIAKLLEDIKTTGADPLIRLTEEEYKKKFSFLEPIKLEPKALPLPGYLEGGVLNGHALSLPKPEYPLSAKSLHLNGRVIVQVLIDETGKVISARALSGPVAFRKASVKAARHATFTIKTLSGRPVKVKGIILYDFVGE
jgi:hypothetical protein